MVQNREYILDYRIRLTALGYNCEGFRGLGSGESNVGRVCARIWGRSWSSEGLSALANVLFKLINGNLSLYTQQVTSLIKQTEEKVVASAAQVIRKAVATAGPAVRRVISLTGVLTATLSCSDRSCGRDLALTSAGRHTQQSGLVLAPVSRAGLQ